MKLKLYTIPALLTAGLFISNIANAQWTRNAGTHSIYATNIGDSIGIGTTAPQFKFDVRATGIATMQFKSATNNASILLDRGTASNTASLTYRTGGSNNWQTGCITNNNYTIRNNGLVATALYINALTNNVGVGTISPANKFSVGGNADISGRLGIGTTTPGNQLHVEGIASELIPVINSHVNYVGSSDVRAIQGISRPSDGWGYGVYGEGGWIGVYGSGNSATTSSFGVYGYASGGAGSQYGVYGSAYNSAGPAWAGYFSGNTYASNMIVGNATAPSAGYSLTVGGKIIATEVRVQLQPFPDYVFADDYKLPTISEMEYLIKTHKHLPGMPSACEVEENGLSLGEMQGKVVEKVEEQALYIISLQKQIDELKNEIKAMKK